MALAAVATPPEGGAGRHWLSGVAGGCHWPVDGPGPPTGWRFSSNTLVGSYSGPSFFSCGACVCSLIGAEVISVNMSKSGHSLRMEASLVSVQTPLLTSSMILGKLLDLSEALFPFLYNGILNMEGL